MFVTLANARDLDGLLALYEPDAAYVAADGSRVVGAEAIRALLGGMLAAEPRFENATNYVVESGSIALLSNTWTAVVKPPEAEPVELGGTSIEVARRQPDGSWRYVIDAPASLT